ncbi:hypothetical protein BAUCODRAFT_122770 [Baudoinia panamericana UAMH 10762]|uniref:Uncharacterized protein n=1 Tax=Baudoinia panamericana (strain UAMH 10762) TaxID=717646 RepID=M2MJE2_BAUPA|nr:uncharacterized protein BAUCODRAFT_122770 [Baudoinia panamericana UAMH 10762]EMC96806.1 hypothetical protein BAUCODRAFT_122770 [Baudoinia panamericana UAMH 10762]
MEHLTPSFVQAKQALRKSDTSKLRECGTNGIDGDGSADEAWCYEQSINALRGATDAEVNTAGGDWYGWMALMQQETK